MDHMQEASSVGACCEPEEYDDEFDVTMASCCQRDLAQQAQARLHLKRLKAVDPSTRRADLTSAVLATPVGCDETQEAADSTQTDAGEYQCAVQHKPAMQ